MGSSDLETARSIHRKATAAKSDSNHTEASQLFFRAAEHYERAGKPYWQKLCEGKGWSQRAFGIDEITIEDLKESAECFDKSIQAYNNALRYLEADVVEEANMRFTEVDKYNSLARVEIKSAKATSGKASAGHLHRAADYNLSGATASKQVAETDLLNGDIARYYSRLGAYHFDKSGYHFYRASAAEELEAWLEALEGYQRARRESETSIDNYRKSIFDEQNESREYNLQLSETFLEECFDGVARARPKAEQLELTAAAPPPPDAAPPALDLTVAAAEGMVENLVATLSVALANRGGSEARNIYVVLSSQFLEGHTTATLARLAAGGEDRLGLSVLPTRAGSPPATLIVSYEDANGQSYNQVASAQLDVARQEENRPEPATIISVQGD